MIRVPRGKTLWHRWIGGGYGGRAVSRTLPVPDLPYWELSDADKEFVDAWTDDLLCVI